MPSAQKQPRRQALEKPGFAPARPRQNKKFSSNELLNPARRGRTWTPEQRAAQAAKIRRWQPWAQSTGPKTAQGKTRAAQNALKHGSYSALERKLKHLLREQLAFVRMVEAHLRLLRQPQTSLRNNKTFLKKPNATDAKNATIYLAVTGPLASVAVKNFTQTQKLLKKPMLHPNPHRAPGLEPGEAIQYKKAGLPRRLRPLAMTALKTARNHNFLPISPPLPVYPPP